MVKANSQKQSSLIDPKASYPVHSTIKKRNRIIWEMLKYLDGNAFGQLHDWHHIKHTNDRHILTSTFKLEFNRSM